MSGRRAKALRRDYRVLRMSATRIVTWRTFKRLWHSRSQAYR